MELNNFVNIFNSLFKKSQTLNSSYYIHLYNMKTKAKKLILHSPTLESVLMVERTIDKYSGECGKYQLWKKLPKKMMYQTFIVILDYLTHSNKIILDRGGKIVWIWDPQGINKFLKKTSKFM